MDEYTKPQPRLDEKGREIPDNEPIVIRVRQRTIQQFDHIKAYIRRELSEAAGAGQFETFDEANDFDVPDEEIRHSPHEYSEEQEVREREKFEDARDQARKTFDETHAKRKKHRLAARNEQGNAPTTPADPTTDPQND